MKRKRVYLIEWRMKETGWSEIGQGIWEVDHNAGIWFTQEGAQAEEEKLLSEHELYEMRVTEYVPLDQCHGQQRVTLSTGNACADLAVWIEYQIDVLHRYSADVLKQVRATLMEYATHAQETTK